MRVTSDPTEEFIRQRLNKNLYTQLGTLLLPANTVLKKEHLDLIHMHHICLLKDDVEDEWDNQNHHTVEAVISELRAIFEQAKHLDQLDLTDAKDRILPHMKQLTRSKRIFQLLEALRHKDDYTYHHNVAVGLISTMIGKWLKLTQNEMDELTLAATCYSQYTSSNYPVILFLARKYVVLP